MHLMLRREGEHVRECDVLEMNVGIHRHGRFCQEVRLSIQLESATIKDHGVDMYIGGILMGLRSHISNVARAEIQLADVQGLGGGVLAIGDVSVIDAKFIDLQRIDGKHRLLPSLLIGRRVLHFLGGLWPGEVDDGVIDPLVADEVTGQ